MPSKRADLIQIMLVYVTVPSVAVGAELARTLVSEELSACVNLIPNLTSFYRWDGKLNEETEALMLIKTTDTALAKLERRIKELHPYENPEFVAVAAKHVAANYGQWVKDQTTTG